MLEGGRCRVEWDKGGKKKRDNCNSIINKKITLKWYSIKHFLNNKKKDLNLDDKGVYLSLHSCLPFLPTKP